MYRAATWYLALDRSRPAVEVLGVEAVPARDRFTVRADSPAVPLGRPCVCGRTFRTRQEAVDHAKAHAAVARSAYVDFDRIPSDPAGVVGHLTPDPDEANGFARDRFTNERVTICTACGRRTPDGKDLCAECQAVLETSRMPSAEGDGSLEGWLDAMLDMYVRRPDPDDARAIAKKRFVRLGALLLAEASRPDRQFSPVRRYRLCQPGQHRGVSLENGAIECKRCHERKPA